MSTVNDILRCPVFKFDKLSDNLCAENMHQRDSPNCNHCNIPETTHHFLFECPQYQNQRIELMNFLISHPQIYEPIVIAEKDLLCGNKDISDENNKELLLAVSKFITSSNRFN